MPQLRRFGAWLIDFALVVAAAWLLAVLTFNRIGTLITDVPELVTKGSWQFVKSGGDAQGATDDLVDSLWRDAVGYIQQGFLALVLVTFLYQWLTLNFTGRTLGKAVMGLRVTPNTRSRTALRAAVTTAADVAVYSLACCMLVQGWIFLSVICWIAAVALFTLNALPVFSRSSRSLADRVAGTSVTAPGFAGMLPSARREPDRPQRDLTSW
ncbi:RDD family protein [Streptomyces aureoverticillatus]|uniref:RDD family protein n=1 Tax=Streptomyces aureoverticillatus TaxID=66871 RepID=UPI001EF84D04|nr:RDD family protein [Streptomyces aureoverticillatus]